MRRSLSLLVLVAAIVGVTPAPAHAYFWDWVDSLSGPEFHGATVEWKVWCKTESAEAMIKSFRVDMDRVATKFAAHKTFGNIHSRLAYATSLTALQISKTLADEALVSLRGTSGVDPSRQLAEALRFRKIAKRRFELAEKLDALEVGVRTLTAEANEWVKEVNVEVVGPQIGKSEFHRSSIIAGIGVSMCEAGILERHTRVLNLNFAWSYDKLHKDDGNRMVTIGASYNAVLTPWLTAGLGAGVATFTSKNAVTFHKLYVEPYIIDFRPLAVKQSRYSQNPWPQVIFVRYSTIMFPAGFEEFRFGNSSPQYPAELVHTYGVHADLEPLIRKLRGRY